MTSKTPKATKAAPSQPDPQDQNEEEEGDQVRAEHDEEGARATLEEMHSLPQRVPERVPEFAREGRE